jgi:glutaredoxin
MVPAAFHHRGYRPYDPCDLLASLPMMRERPMRFLLPLLLLLLSCATATATAAPSPTANPTLIEVFVREGCPHCSEAKHYLSQLSRSRPDIQVRLRPVDQDPLARDELLRISRDSGHWPPAVPTFVINGEVLVGFTDGERTGPLLLALVDRRQADAPVVSAGPLGELSVERLGLPLFTLALGLLDGFNPCAMWVLLFLLSLLVRLHDRQRMALIAGTFVAVSGIVYYAFMAAWLNLFLLVGLSALLTRALGGVAVLIGLINLRDSLRRQGGYTFAIPDSAKPGLYARVRDILQTHALLPALAAVASLAVAVNFIELLCTAGLPAIYTAVLAQQQLEPLAHYGYLALYILGYIADDALMVGTAVAALGSRKLSERSGRTLKLLSGVVMLALGLILLLRPDWLS